MKYCYLILFVFGTSFAFGQFTSVPAGGNWNVGATWGNAGNTPGVDFPSTGDIVNVNSVVTIPASFAASAGTITIQSVAGASLTIANTGSLSFTGVLTVGIGPSNRGRLIVNGTVIVEQGATMAGGLGAPARFFIGATGIYRHNYTASPGDLYAATWDIGSTLQITGYNSIGVTTGPASGLNQSFYNVTWNCAAQANDLYLDGSLTTILGSLNIQNTNGFVVGLTTTAPTTLTISGNLSIGVFSYLDMTGGPGNAQINLAGDFTMNDIDGLGDYGVGAGTATLLFNGIVLQNYFSTSTISSPVNIEVANSSVLKLAGNNFVSTAGTFALDASSNLQVGSTDPGGAIQTGVAAGNIRVLVANRSYNSSSTITYNGTALQRIGNAFPGNVNLEIANASGVLNNNIGTTNVVGNLILTTGPLNIGNSNTLNIQSNFITTGGGTIGGSATSNLTFSGSGTIGTLSFAPGAEILNDLTVGRNGDVVLGSNLTVGGVINLSFGNLDFSGHTLTMNGSAINSSGTGLKSNATSNLAFGGSTFSGAVPFIGAGNQLNTLNFSTPGGTFTWSNNVTINTSLTLNAGALTHTAGLTMASNATIFKGAGSLAGSSPNAAPSYNVSYTGTGTTGLELPLSTTALHDLTINSSGTLNLNSPITVNGTLTTSGGTFNTGVNAIDLKGNFVSNAGATLTGSVVTFSGTTVITGTTTPVFGAITIAIAGSLTPTSSFQVNGNLINNGTLNAGSSTTTFGGSTAISGSSVSSFNNILISGTLTAPGGASSINVAGTFTNNGIFVNSGSTVVFNGTSTIAGTTPTNFGSITVSGTLTAPTTLNVSRDFTNNGSFIHGSGTVVFNGTSVQNILGSVVTNFNNITVTNTTGGPPSVRVQSNQNLLGVLTLSSDGTLGSIFDADGPTNTIVFTLVSSSDGADYNNTTTADASIAALPTGTTRNAAVDGNVTVQRYMSIEGPGSRIYRYISSPVTNAPLSQIQATIPVTGTFTGASSCAGCLTRPSMFTYDETLAGDLTVGYTDFPVSSNTEILQPAKGYAIFERGNINPIAAAGSALWSVRGPVNVANVTPISFPVSFTALNGVPDDGWNLVGNPFPSTIDWNAATGWTKSADLQATIYMTDNAAGTPPTFSTLIATWNGVTGTNGGSRYIAMGQGFYVKSDGPTAPALTANEQVKAAGTQTIFFREAAPVDLLRITMRQNTLKDEIVIHFRSDATEEYDRNADAYKLQNNIFNLSSLTQNLKLAINSLPLLTCTRTVKLDVTDAPPGAYHFDFSNMESFDPAIQIMLHDALAGTDWVNMREHSGFDFQVTADSASFGADRFVVSFGYELPTALALKADSVCGNGDSKITIDHTLSSLNYSASLDGTVIVPATAGNGQTLSFTIDKSRLKFGSNGVTITSQSPNCASLTYSQVVSVKVDSTYTARTTGASNCREGAVTLKASGAPEGGSYNWYETEADAQPIAGQSAAEFQTPVLSKTKTFYVSAANSLGCEGARKPVVATIVNYDDAAITQTDDKTLQSNFLHGNRWSLNGVALADTTAVLTMEASGVYRLDVKIGGCTTSDERTFVVTGLANLEGFRSYPNPVRGLYTVEVYDKENQITDMPIFNTLGGQIGSMKMTTMGSTKRGQFDFSSHSPGMYYIKVVSGDNSSVLKVIKN